MAEAHGIASEWEGEKRAALVEAELNVPQRLNPDHRALDEARADELRLAAKIQTEMHMRPPLRGRVYFD